MLWRSELEMVTTLWVSSKTSILFILCDLFMEDLNYKTTSVRNAVFLSTLLILGVAKKEIWTVWRDSLIPLILGSMSHICLEQYFLKNIETVLVYTYCYLHSWLITGGRWGLYFEKYSFYSFCCHLKSRSFFFWYTDLQHWGKERAAETPILWIYKIINML